MLYRNLESIPLALFNFLISSSTFLASLMVKGKPFLYLTPSTIAFGYWFNCFSTSISFIYVITHYQFKIGKVLSRMACMRRLCERGSYEIDHALSCCNMSYRNLTTQESQYICPILFKNLCSWSMSTLPTVKRETCNLFITVTEI